MEQTEAYKTKFYQNINPNRVKKSATDVGYLGNQTLPTDLCTIFTFLQCKKLIAKQPLRLNSLLIFPSINRWQCFSNIKKPFVRP